MKTVAAIVAVVLFGVAFAQVKSSAPATVRVYGEISDYAGAPLRNAIVKLKAEDQQELTAKTGENGWFLFTDVPPNRIYLLFADGSPTALMHVEVGEADSSPTTVRTLKTPHILTNLHSPVSITGQILDYSGAPIRNENVSLDGSGRESVTTQTDQDGRFSISSVPTDQRYSLHVVATGFSSTTMDIDVAERDLDMGSIIIQPFRPLPLTAVNRPVNSSVRILGRITDANSVPMPERILTFGNRDGISILKTDRNGTFVFPAVSHSEYGLYITESVVPTLLQPPNLKEVGKIEVSAGQDVNMGDIALQFSPKQQGPAGNLVGPGTVTPSPAKGPSVAAVFVGTDGTSIVDNDGKVVRAPKEKEQIGCISLRISEDQHAVGWLVDSDFCCASYSLPHMLVVYRPGKPLRRFAGDGRAIFGWKFVGSGKQVAFEQSFPHGDLMEHYELRDVETGRLIGKWDGDKTPKAPTWTRDL